MAEYRANKQAGEEHDIPDDEVIVNQENIGGVEILTTEKVEQYPCKDEDCDRVFDSERGMRSHYGQVHGED